MGSATNTRTGYKISVESTSSTADDGADYGRDISYVEKPVLLSYVCVKLQL